MREAMEENSSAEGCLLARRAALADRLQLLHIHNQLLYG